MRRTLQWIGVAAALLLAGVVADSARAASRKSVREEMYARGRPYAPGAPIKAAVLLQRSDCTSNLRVFELLDQDDIRARLRLAVVWYVGPSSDSTAIRAALPTWSRSVPLLHVPQGALLDLHRLGHRHTPVLIVQDAEGRIRLTTQSPQSSREFAGLRLIIRGLTWIEEL